MGRTAESIMDHRKSQSMTLPCSTSYNRTPQSTLLDGVASQLLWVSFLHLYYRRMALASLTGYWDYPFRYSYFTSCESMFI